jgi:hypothetical protein
MREIPSPVSECVDERGREAFGARPKVRSRVYPNAAAVGRRGPGDGGVFSGPGRVSPRGTWATQEIGQLKIDNR